MEYQYILALETSCDETSAAVIANGKILANIVATQEVHIKYGGVIPELASRNHDLFISSVVEEALEKAQVTFQDLNAIAVTQGPGLLGPLMVGITFAKALSWSLSIPIIGINHLQAHIAALYILQPNPDFPLLCLLVSGGHTQLVLLDDRYTQTILGTTIDDAAGEAFDKTAKLLGLPYPGGPMLDKLSQKGNPFAFSFPMPKVGMYDFSFSGIKTAIKNFVQLNTTANSEFVNDNLSDICASVQESINAYLIKKCEKALFDFKPLSIAVVGGVSANSDLRKKMHTLAAKHQVSFLVPELVYCTDNAGMIAIAAHYACLNNDFIELDAVPFTR